MGHVCTIADAPHPHWVMTVMHGLAMSTSFLEPAIRSAAHRPHQTSPSHSRPRYVVFKLGCPAADRGNEEPLGLNENGSASKVVRGY
jgi:hypothetical protein